MVRGAISTGNNSNEFDATLIELAFHDNQQDAELLRDAGVRRAMAYEKKPVADWVRQVFGTAAPGWVDECEVAFSRVPVACYIAVAESAIIGFVCHDCTSRNFLGPIGVAEGSRRSGVGTLLLLTALQAMRNQGYGYAIIGQVGSPGFFSTTVAAIEIPQSDSGVYPPRLKL